MKKQLLQNTIRSSPSLHIPIDTAPSPRRDNEVLPLLPDLIFKPTLTQFSTRVEVSHSKDNDTDLIEEEVRLGGGIADGPEDVPSVSGSQATKNANEQQNAPAIQQSQTPGALPSHHERWNPEAEPLEQDLMGGILSAQAPESPESLVAVRTPIEMGTAVNDGTMVPSTDPALGLTTSKLGPTKTPNKTSHSSPTKELHNDQTHVNGDIEQDTLVDNAVPDALHLPASSAPDHRPLTNVRNSSASMNGDGGPQHSDPRRGSKPEPRLPSGKITQKHLTCYYWKTKGNCRYKEEDCQFAHYYTGLDVDMPSAKNTTCYWWWQNNFCRFSNDDCRFAHYDTGIYADRPGQGSWSGKSLCCRPCHRYHAEP